MRTSRPILLASAALVLAAACSGDVTAPGAPTTVGSSSLSPFFNTSVPPVESDSVIAGYGCPVTGGLEYQNFEYDPETGTEYCVTPDTTTAPPPPPPPPPAPKDSVQSGYGSGSTGGLE